MVRIAKDGAELACEFGPDIDFQVSQLNFNVLAEVTLCCAIEVLNGVINFHLICDKCARLGIEY